MQVQTIKDFCKSKGFTQVAPSVRENTNKYPFITFIDKDNKAENIYFSKAGAKQVAVGTPVDKALLTTFQIGYATNEQGEVRIKLISNSERLELADLFS